MEKIKDIKILNYAEILKQLNEKFPNIDKIYEDFEKEVGNNKWIYIANKNMWFNKEIMACYPNFNNNFQNIKLTIQDKYKDAIEVIKNNKEYKKYDVEWNIQTYNESINSFYEKWHPMESNKANHRIHKNNKFMYKKEKKILFYNNDPKTLNIEEEGILIPIFRLKEDKLHKRFEKTGKIFSLSTEEIFEEFLAKELVVSNFFDNEEKQNEYFESVKNFSIYGKYIKFLKKDKLEIILDANKIEQQICEFNNKEIFNLIDEIKIQLIYSNKDIEIKKYKSNEILSEYIFLNGDVESFKYENRLREGKREILYANGDIEKANYKSGKLEGKAIYKYTNGDVEEYKYHSGVIDGEALYKYANGDIGRLFYTNGVKKDITKLYNLLNIDNIRVNIDKYDENVLFDFGKGHWELFESEELEDLENSIGKKVYGRDPRLDIKKGGIVGIDFGTKSTVVVFQDDKNITLPMRISGNILNKDIEDSDFENPTVMNLIDVESFIKDYGKKEGRPCTKWCDLTVSHAANQNIKDTIADKNELYSIITNLKQWAGSKKEKLLVKDKIGTEKLLPPYLELSDEDFDPIEIYAYYIGSYINNMRNGIYLEYYLSFPVTYEKAIRNRILKSFERGIKKSLPITILKDEEVMKKFKVKHGANEPAAYAVCALQEYGFEPEDEEKVYYGVFDFGGGTLDFDFGIFKEADDIRYDYELEHFGAGGDRYLGGENILQELAYEVFKENVKVLRQKQITFARPEWCDRFIGDETLVDNNGISKLNIKFLIEKIRDIWESNADIDPKITCNLYNKDTKMLSGVELEVDADKLKEIINKKIDGGINNFFIAMEKAFKNIDYDKIYILLAGNSCKHPYVSESFENMIAQKQIQAQIMPPLGTEQAYEKLQDLGMEVDKNDKTKPTGKTGVAYGLLLSTPDSCIKIINKDEDESSEIKFKYYVGIEKKKRLKPVITPNSEYDNFMLFSYVKTDVFNIYYTSIPEASEGKLPIESVKRIRVALKQEYDADTMIYLRAVGADTVEYAITKKDITEKEYLETGKIILE